MSPSNSGATNFPAAPSYARAEWMLPWQNCIHRLTTRLSCQGWPIFRVSSRYPTAQTHGFQDTRGDAPPLVKQSSARNCRLPSSQDKRLVCLGGVCWDFVLRIHISRPACPSASNFVKREHADSAAHYARTAAESMKI